MSYVTRRLASSAISQGSWRWSSSCLGSCPCSRKAFRSSVAVILRSHSTSSSSATVTPGGRIHATIYPGGRRPSSEQGSTNSRRRNKNPTAKRNNRRGSPPSTAASSSRHRKQRGQSTYKFVDRARIRVAGGNGGSGSMSNQHIGRYKRRPDGGHGGDGGAVILVASPNEQTLGMSVHHYSGEDGKPGGSRGMNGRCGKNTIVRVPCGVLVRRVLDYDEVWDEKEEVVRSIGEDDEDNRNVLLSSSDADDQDIGAEEEGHQYTPQTIHVGSEEENYFTDHEAGSGQEGYDEIKGSNIGSNDEEDFDESEYGEEEEEDTENELDIENVVNTGIKASDGMYHWRPEPMPNDGTEEEWVSSTSDIFNYEREKVLIADLDKPGTYVVLATGGRGGTGSSAYAKKQWNPGLMANASERRVGRPGETAHLELELKLIADLGLVGFPNAGKSSLLSSMSEAKPEIAPYPFTTLHPLVGTIRYRDGFRVIAADVPGLIDGASEGRGRGHDFLRHLERTKALLYIVDAASVDGRNPIDDLYTLADEISSYGDGDMMNRPALLVANKMDLIAGETQRESLLFDLAVAAEDAGIYHHGDVLGISAGVTGEGLSLLSKSIRMVVTEGEANRLISEAAS